MFRLGFEDLIGALKKDAVARVAFGRGAGEKMAVAAMQEAFAYQKEIVNAKTLVVFYECAPDLAMDDLSQALDLLKSKAPESNNVLLDLAINNDLDNQARLKIIATDFIK